MIVDQTKVQCVVDRKLLTLFKQADSVCFHWTGSTDGSVSKGRMTLGKKRRGDGPWDNDGSEATIEIELSGSCRYFGGYAGGRYKPSSVRCVSSITSAKFDEVWRSVIHVLRCGDELQMSWVGANNNQYCDRAGLFNDSLQLRIKRGEDYLFFVIGSGVCEDNSARMIKAS
jgi:hypothetical protein